MAERREAKKRETRERISDVATRLFFQHGFEAVTLDEIAVAAGVSKMTVFNYFARKEDLMLDRESDLLLVPLRDALRARPKGQAPADALHAVIHTMTDSEHAYLRFDDIVAGWWRVVAASPSLEARLRELADEAMDGLALALGGPDPDATARLAAGTIVLTVRVAREQALRVFARHASPKKAKAAFLATFDRGLDAVRALG